MKKLRLLCSFLLTLVFSGSVLALSTPTVDSVPSQMNADFYTFTIHVPVGSTVNVLGGPSYISPTTDGAGNDESDGEVEVMVGLAQEQVNVFSITAEREGDFSGSLEVTIHETSGAQGQPGQGDTTPPSAPVLDPIENPVAAYTYMITGSVEADANIYVRKGGDTVGSTRANSNGIFFVEVDLEVGKTNRFNVSAEDAAGNEGMASQAVVQATQPDTPAPTDEPVVISGCPFTDTIGHWSENYVCQMYNAGIVSGRSETEFDPNSNITRAELTKIALETFDISVPESVELSPFPDVPTYAWYARYIQVAKEMAIVGGYTDDTFRPDSPINRAATLKILVIASDLDDVGYTADFPDVVPHAWFAKYVGFAQANNVVGGYADGKFHPDGLITRAEVAKIAMKLLEMKE